MPRITDILRSITGAAVVATALAGAATAGTITAGSPGAQPSGTLTSGTGCSSSCISSALVTPTASSASVEVTTTVATSTTVTVSRLDQQLGLAAGTQPRHVVVPAFQTTRTILFGGLEPDTGYRIVVSAKDEQGRIQARQGTFRTRAVKVAVDQPDLGLSAGVGCKADCIEHGTSRRHPTEVGRMDFDVRLSEPGRAQLELYRMNATGGLVLQRTIASSNGIETWAPSVTGLLAGTEYRARLQATDGAGRSRVEWGRFRTASARAIVTFHSVKVLADGEVGKGEISFDYFVEGASVGGKGFQKIGSGETVAAVARGTSRRTVTIVTPIDGHLNLDVAVFGAECDGSLMKNCTVEAGDHWNGAFGSETQTLARAAFDLRTLTAQAGTLPPGFGTGLPAGHDGYLVWQDTAHELKFRVHATVDFEVVA